MVMSYISYHKPNVYSKQDWISAMWAVKCCGRNGLLVVMALKKVE